jgi:putative intracellular protease/amidase
LATAGPGQILPPSAQKRLLAKALSDGQARRPPGTQTAAANAIAQVKSSPYVLKNIEARIRFMAKVAIILTQGFADWEYALIAGAGGPFYGLDVQYFSPQTGQIASQGGLAALVSQDLDMLSSWSADVVVVVGGTIWETDNAPDIGKLLKTLHAGGACIAGICGGTLALARAGLLNDVAHTSNDADFLKQNAAGYTGDAHYQSSASAISAGRVITAAGTAPVGFTAAVFAASALPKETVSQFKGIMAAEHAKA